MFELDMSNINGRLDNHINDEPINENFEKMSDDRKIDFVAERILEVYRPAFEELAK